MHLSFIFNGNSFTIDTSKPIDISLGVRHDGLGANCFYTDKAIFEPYRAGNFVGSVAAGGVCNVDVIRFTPHGNGTHTECIGHIIAEQHLIANALPQGIMVAQLITVFPEPSEGDLCITKQDLMQSVKLNGAEAIIVRTHPNPIEKTNTDYSGSNPTYFSDEALELLNSLGVKHLLCDIPSVDREDDGGKLLAHKAFFGEGELSRYDTTITELIYCSDNIEDGMYLLDIQIANFQSDASPSRPILYELMASEC